MIVHVVGARPNFMKAAAVVTAMRELGLEQLVVHTGQHYDEKMSGLFFEQLRLPHPDVNLEVGSGSHARQTADIMVRFEDFVVARKPSIVLVYGDVNSTLAAALVCSKLDVPLAHVEAGLRSNDRSMPEEINRIVTDRLSDLFFTPSSEADENLVREGTLPEKIHMVGNVMIDTLVRLRPEACKAWDALREAPRLAEVLRNQYLLVTLHRPSNVDDPTRLQAIVETLRELSEALPLVFPVHPRTRQRLDDVPRSGNMVLIEPVGYLESIALQSHATAIITDSGGVQEESTFLGVPCFTLRPNTERPVTVTVGTNTMIGSDMQALRSGILDVLDGRKKKASIPTLWDGRSGYRIAEVIRDYLGSKMQSQRATRI